MSINVMSLVFRATLDENLPYEKDGEKRNAKASTVKLLLLAYADHANDEGEGAYPGYDKLEIKTALSRQGIADTIEAIKQNNLFIFEGVSKYGTNSYKLNIEELERRVKPLDSAKSSHLTQTSQATRLKPSLNHTKKPSLKIAAKTPKTPTPDEIKLFREVKGRYPNKATWELVTEKIKAVSSRLLRPATKEDLRPFYVSWTSKGYNPENLAWLDWAVSGTVPINSKVAGIQEPKAFDGVREYLKGLQNVNAN